MGLKVAIQMDPIGSIDIHGDSTFRLALEAEARGHTLFYYHVEDLVWNHGRVTATGHDLTVRRGSRATTSRSAHGARSIWPTGTWSCCVRTRPST